MCEYLDGSLSWSKSFIVFSFAGLCINGCVTYSGRDGLKNGLEFFSSVHVWNRFIREK